MKKIPLRWKINPSSPENFYENLEIHEEFSYGKETIEEDISEDITELDIEEIISENTKETVSEPETIDPYSQILKDLK